MIVGEPLALPPEAAGAAKEYLRVVGADEDPLLAQLVLSAAELCESFTGQALIARTFVETMAASSSWQRLGRTPVRTIGLVEAVPKEGAPSALTNGSYAIDIDANGDGWVRMYAPGHGSRLRVTYEAGTAEEWAGLPAALRQGCVRLAAHLYSHRVSEGVPSAQEPPAAVTALWRPFRRMRLR